MTASRRVYIRNSADEHFATLAAQCKEDLRKQEEWENSLIRDPLELNPSDLHEYSVSDKPDTCAYVSLDFEHLTRITRFRIHGRIKPSGYIQPYYAGGKTLGRFILGIGPDEQNIRIRYLNGNRLDNRRCNLEAYKAGTSYSSVSYGPGWQRIRSLVKIRSRGICELCRKVPSEDVHHCIPVRFYREPSEAHFMENLLDVCRPCHRREHEEIKHRMPLFKSLKFPLAQSRLLR